MKEEGEKFILKVVERPLEILNRNLVDYILKWCHHHLT